MKHYLIATACAALAAGPALATDYKPSRGHEAFAGVYERGDARDRDAAVSRDVLTAEGEPVQLGRVDPDARELRRGDAGRYDEINYDYGRR